MDLLTPMASLRAFVERNHEDLNIHEAEVDARVAEWLKSDWWNTRMGDVGEILGFVALKFGQHHSDGHVASLRLAVDRDHWNEGIGTSLLEQAISVARVMGAHRLEATPYMPLTPWRYHLFIDKGGFEIESVMRDRVRRGDTSVDVLMLVRHL